MKINNFLLGNLHYPLIVHFYSFENIIFILTKGLILGLFTLVMLKLNPSDYANQNKNRFLLFIMQRVLLVFKNMKEYIDKIVLGFTYPNSQTNYRAINYSL